MLGNTAQVMGFGVLHPLVTARPGTWCGSMPGPGWISSSMDSDPWRRPSRSSQAWMASAILTRPSSRAAAPSCSRPMRGTSNWVASCCGAGPEGPCGLQARPLRGRGASPGEHAQPGWCGGHPRGRRGVLDPPPGEAPAGGCPGRHARRPGLQPERCVHVLFRTRGALPPGTLGTGRHDRGAHHHDLFLHRRGAPIPRPLRGAPPHTWREGSAHGGHRSRHEGLCG